MTKQQLSILGSLVMAMVLAVLGCANPASAPLAQSGEKAITAMRFAGMSPVVAGVITTTADAHEVALTVPYATDVTALVPTIAITGVSISPASGAAREAMKRTVSGGTPVASAVASAAVAGAAAL